MRQVFMVLVFALTVWFGIISVRPYWDRYWLQMDIEEAALYGRDRSEKEIRRFLMGKMHEKGRHVDEEDLLISRDEKDNVHVKASYQDQVRVAGHTLIRLQFTLEAWEREKAVKE